MKAKFLSIFIVVCMMMIVMPLTVSAETQYEVYIDYGSVTIDDNNLTYTDSGNENQTEPLKDNDTILIKQTNSEIPTENTITVENGANVNIILEGVNIDVSSTDKACAFDIKENSNVNLTLSGDNTLKSGSSSAGLQLHESSEVTIDGSGSLKAIGGNGGAGIGGAYLGNGGTIDISGGDVTAIGGKNAAGIGGGLAGNGGTIDISGGTVTAIGGAGGEISGVAYSGENAAGIGAGADYIIDPGGSSGAVNSRYPKSGDITISSTTKLLATSTGAKKAIDDEDGIISSNIDGSVANVFNLKFENTVTANTKIEVRDSNGLALNPTIEYAPTMDYSSIAFTMPNTGDYTILTDGIFQATDGNDGIFKLTAGLTSFDNVDKADFNFVYLNQNDGTGTITSAKIDSDGNLLDTLPTPTRKGYEFLGWYDALTGGTEVNENAPLTPNAKIFAMWKITEYNITYTGLDNVTSWEDNTKTNPSSYTFQDEFTLINPIKENYIFKGWKKAGDATPTLTMTIPQGSTGDIIFEATWEDISENPDPETPDPENPNPENPNPENPNPENPNPENPNPENPNPENPNPENPVEKLTITGRLVDANGNPMANVVVAMFSEPVFTFTDANGYYKLENVPVGTHTLRVFSTQADFEKYAAEMKAGTTPSVKPILEITNVIVSKDANNKTIVNIDGKLYNEDAFFIQIKADGTASVTTTAPTVTTVPKTSDTNNIMVFVVLLAVSMVGIVAFKKAKSK